MNQKELKELIEFLIEKDIAEFELERGDVKVKIKRAAEAPPLRRRWFRLPLLPARGLIWQRMPAANRLRLMKTCTLCARPLWARFMNLRRPARLRL
jgi:hypothetical protein